MQNSDHDRNLLFGILALQMDFISREGLVAAMNAWVLAKEKTLGELLVAQKTLSDANYGLLNSLVDAHVKQHADDPQKSLSAVDVEGSIKDDLKQLNDGDVNATILLVGTRLSPNAASETAGDVTIDAGQTIATGARFHILRPHAEGALGKVYVARDKELEREVALKEIKAQHADNSASRARFLLEAQINGGLEHPNIVPVYGLGKYADGRPYYAMRFIRGESLKVAVDRYHDPKTEKSTVGAHDMKLRKLLGQFIHVCHAIDYAHSRGVLHRDLKPVNVMLGKYGETLVVDWGLAKALDKLEPLADSGEGVLKPSSGSGAAATQMGAALGTPQFMSPEQAEGRLDKLSSASDVYSLGATLYYILTGRAPIDSDEVGAVLEKVRLGDIQPMRAVNAKVSRALEAICMKAMALKPESRYPSPKALATDIEHWLADEPVPAYSEPLLTRLSRRARRHKVTTAALLALLIAAVFGLSIGTMLLSREKSKTEQARTIAVNAQTETNKKNELLLERNLEIEEGRKQTQRQLALFYAERAGNEWEHGDRGMAFAIYGQAYRAAVSANDAVLRKSLCSLLGAAQPTLRRALAHDGQVYNLVFSPDGRKLATASTDKTARIWDVVTGQPRTKPLRHNDVVECVAFSPDGSKLATASDDHTARLWDATTGEPLAEPMVQNSCVLRVVFSPDGKKIATGGDDQTARLWDAATCRAVGVPMQHAGSVGSVVFSPDGRMLATAGSDHTARLWDVATCRPIGSPMRHDSWIQALAFSPDAAELATASEDRTARLWSTETTQPIGEVMTHHSEVRGVAFSPDGTRLATASYDHTARLWDAKTGRPLGQPMVHVGGVRSVAFSPDGTRLATGSYDQTARLWDATTGQPLAPPMKHDGRLLKVAFSPDGSILATASVDNMARLWDVAADKPYDEQIQCGGNVDSLAFNADGSKIATGCGPGSDNKGFARIWDTFSGRPSSNAMTHEGLVRGVAFSPDSTKIATASEDHTARLWDAATCKPLGEPMKHNDLVQGVAFSPDGTKLATAGWDHTAQLWDATTGHPLGEPLKHDSLVCGVAFSRDGKRLAIACADHAAYIYDVATRRRLGTPMWHDDNVQTAAFSSDGKKLATASDDCTARIWDTSSCRPISAPLRHAQSVRQATFSSDGTMVATASYDRTVRLWDAATGWQLGDPLMHDGGVSDVMFSPDGKRLATASNGQTVEFWAVPHAVVDDPNWVSAFVEAASGMKENASGIITRISVDDAERAWKEVSAAPQRFDQMKQDAAERTLRWHVSEAAEYEAKGPAFAAAFHLRCICRSDPRNDDWRDRLQAAEQKDQINHPAKTIPIKPSTDWQTSIRERFPSARKLLSAHERWSFSPDGSRIVCVVDGKPGQRDLKLFDIATNKIQDSIENGHDPAWSPVDGRWIAFERRDDNVPNSSRIWLVEATGGKPKEFCEGVFPFWSADGKAIYCFSNVSHKIMSVDLKTSASKPFSGIGYGYPGISPDGKRLVVPKGGGLTIADRESGNVVRSCPLDGWQGLVSGWSPDGTQIGFGSFGGTNQVGLWLMDVETGRRTLVTDGPWTVPVWSPDGSKFTFQHRGIDDCSIWMIDAKELTKWKPEQSKK